MKKIISILFALLFLSHAKAQLNLVPNPSFDGTLTGCPTGPGQWGLCNNWKNTYPGVLSGYCSSPDYYNTCSGTSFPIPNTIMGTCSPHSGSGMMGICPYSMYIAQYREYIYDQLNCTMKPGVTYTVSLWSRLASPTANSLTVKYMGVHLSTNALSQTCGETLSVTPQWETTSNTDINTTWQQFTFTVNPTANWNYITLGSFNRTDLQNNLTPYVGTSTVSNAYYFFDDVAVLTSTASFNLSTSLSQPGCGGSTGSASVIPTNTSLAYSYTWSSGGSTSSTGSSLSPGNYTVWVAGTNGCTVTTIPVTFTVNAVPPTPTVTISGAPSVYCAGHSMTLTASGATNYTWYPGGSTSNPIIVSPTIATTYTLIGTNAYGCSNITTYTLGAPLPNPTVSVVSTPTLRCAGTPANLTASGASTYVWLPGSWSGNPYVVNPSIATVYTVTGTGVNGCTATSVYTLAAPLPNPTVTVVASSTVICAGYPNTLTASGASTYAWYPVTSSSATVVVTPTAPTVYYVFGSSAAGCQSFATVTLTTGSPIGLSVSNVTLCTNAATSTTIGATTTFTAGPVTYYWQPGGLFGQTVTVSPTSDTFYTVTATSPAGCQTATTLAVFVTTNCCSQPTTNLTALTGLTGGTYAGTSYFLSSNITLSGGSNILSNSEVLIMPGVQIIVPAGEVLNLDHTHLYACGINMWQGIVIQDGGQIITSNTRNGSSFIEDAVVAIDVDNITAAHASPPISIDNLIFNKNYIGIKLSNSTSAVTALPIRVTECVFTSRKMNFTSPAPFTSASWPNTSVASGGLRFPYSSTATQGLIPPFQLAGNAPSNLKLPYPNQPGHVGIKIYNVGDQTSTVPSVGIDMGFTYASGTNMFNLFDWLGTGIDVQDASLTTMNNVFQNMQQYGTNNGLYGGTGINHNMTTLMNAQLYLNPSTSSTTEGNLFWDCYSGISTNNVYDVNVQYSTIRSTHNISSGYGRGSKGLSMNSNRFKYNVKFSEFNNLDTCLLINTSGGNYDMGSGLNNGIYADNVTINQNYFGADVTSSPMPAIPQYCGFAITVNGVNGSNWQIASNCSILSNKIDRAFRGIRINSMMDYPIEIGGNDIQIFDDNFVLTYLDQYGIYANDSRDNLFINENIIRGEGAPSPGAWNTRLRLVLSENNQSLSNTVSPKITCNQAYDGYIGFEFNGPQQYTEWTGNTMYQKMFKGLSLIFNGQIGTQGNPTQGCNDRWDDNSNLPPFQWLGYANWQTYVDGSSNANAGSFLWCEPFVTTMPSANGSSGPPFFAFTVPTSLDYVKASMNPDCFYPVIYPSTPSQRIVGPNTITKLDEHGNITGDWNVEVNPNPSNGNITISGALENESFTVKIIDVTGKVVYTKNIIGNLNSLDISSLTPSIYFFEIQRKDGKIIRKKLIKE